MAGNCRHPGTFTVPGQDGADRVTSLNQLTDALVYIRQPEYWEIEVVGSLRGTGLAGPAPYAESLELAAQTYDIPCTMIGSGCCTGPISSVEQKGGDHHTATRPCPGGCGTVGRRVQLLVWQVGPLGRWKGQAVIDTAASSRRWRPGTPRRLAGRTAGPVRCSGSRSEIVLGGEQPVQRSGSGAPAAGRPGAAAGGAADPDGR